MNIKSFMREFLKDSEKTGRFIVKSQYSDKIYFVEPIHNGNPFLWGDYDPATKKMTGDYGNKYLGAITENESLLTKENGFVEVSYVHQGSPLGLIDQKEMKLKQEK